MLFTTIDISKTKKYSGGLLLIYSITTNPSIDYVVGLSEIEIGAVNRLQSDYKLPGGKGINVSRILKQLDFPSIALGFVGGFTGRFLQSQLEQLGLTTNFTEVVDDTRINVKLKADQETEFNASGPTIRPNEKNAFVSKLKHCLQPGDVVIMAGSLPKGLPKNFYHELVALIKAADADFVIDTTGQALLNTLVDHPYVVKPNHHELAELFKDSEYPSLESIAIAGHKLLKLGAKHVLISMASKGALMITPDAIYYGTVSPDKVINSVGAGDSMLAGFVGTMKRTGNALEAFKVALACGSATAFSLDLATKSKINAVYQNITIKKL